MAALGACGQSETAQPEPEQEGTTMPSEEPPEDSPGAQSPAAREAVADLAQRLGVSEDAVRVVSMEEVTWRDGSLGCAQEGMMYTQALVDGSRIVLDVDGRTYEYHQGQGRVFWCEKPTQ
ncbi:MAG: AsnC family protein [Nocardioides sp.]